jgi:hypothetical protein
MTALWPVQILLLGSAVPVAVEAYKAKPPGFYVLWAITALLVVAGLVAPMLVSKPVAAALYEMATNPGTWFVLAVGLFFVMRPFWQTKSSPPSAPVTLDQLAANGVLVQVGRLREQLDALSGLDPASMDALRRDVGELSTRIKNTEAVVGAKVASLSKKVEEYQATHKTVIDDYQRMLAMEGRLDEAKEARAKIEKTFGMIYISFQALLARERVQRFTEAIMREGEFLTSRVNAREPVKGEHWQEWRAHKTTYESAMRHWMDIARSWHPKMEEWINALHPAMLTDGRWAGIDDQFEGSNAVIEYQTFAIQFENWKRFEGNILSAIHAAAFGGPNAEKLMEAMLNGTPVIQEVTEALSDE